MRDALVRARDPEYLEKLMKEMKDFVVQDREEKIFITKCEDGGLMPIRVEKLDGMFEVHDLLEKHERQYFKEHELPEYIKKQLALLYLTEPDIFGSGSDVEGFRFSDTVFYIPKAFHDE